MPKYKVTRTEREVVFVDAEDEQGAQDAAAQLPNGSWSWESGSDPDEYEIEEEGEPK